MNNYKTVFFVAGVLLIVLGVFMFIPFFVQLIYDEQNSTFLSSSAITIFIGILLVLTKTFKFFKRIRYTSEWFMQIFF